MPAGYAGFGVGLLRPLDSYAGFGACFAGFGAGFARWLDTQGFDAGFARWLDTQGFDAGFGTCFAGFARCIQASPVARAWRGLARFARWADLRVGGEQTSTIVELLN